MMPPSVILSRFCNFSDADNLVRSRASTNIQSDTLKDIEPSWSHPTSGKWVIGYKQDGDHVSKVKVRWIQECKEYVSIDNQRQKILGWVDG